MAGGQHDGVEQEFLTDLSRLGALHQAHLARKWSLRAVARVIGLSATTVSEWLKGSRFPQQPDAFTNLITLLRAALAEAGIDLPPGDRHLLDPDAWRARHQAVARQRAEAVSAGIRRAQAAAALADAEVRARFAALPDKPRPVAAWTAQQLGVHPAIHGTTDGADSAFVLPDYIERDHDRQLRARLDKAAASPQTVMVVVRGESCTGKTRTAYEAVRACLGGWQLVFPKDADSLLALLATDALMPRSVLWLNEVQDFLAGPVGEAASAALRRRLEEPGPGVVLATLWPAYHRALTTTPEPGNDKRPHARALLGPVVPVDIPGLFTAKDLENLRAGAHSSLTVADRTSPGGTITQTLAAGPQLADHYEQAVLPYGPYGKAIITVAMDARRLGHTSPLPAALLKAGAPGYLTEQQCAAADPDTWFAHALDYARTKVKGVAAALEPVADPNGMGALPDVYRLSDYLDHHARTIRCNAFPPDSFWTAARDHAASTADLEALAEAADQRGRYGIAADLYQRAADAGGTGALAELAWRHGRAGDLGGAEQLYQRLIDAGDTGALAELANLRQRAGDLDGAETLAQWAADAGDTGPLVELAWRRGEAGDLDGAERLALRAAATGNINALVRLARRYEEAGDLDGAERLAQQAAHIGGRDAVIRLARARERAGDAEGGKRWRQFGL
ncbi:helix-turn-helix transcriptional regulator [Streptomyces halstedii]|uniref:Helix-turn-helix transcriptional regulator n=1 Tax=Streptomyces halstedii TaxID=1944 RepID=A0A6N9UAH1_STRHA|nr:helix-turn-helix transcriptional regulator [Streptomyces halstedii]